MESSPVRRARKWVVEATTAMGERLRGFSGFEVPLGPGAVPEYLMLDPSVSRKRQAMGCQKG